jgi:hypothetical protein
VSGGGETAVPHDVHLPAVLGGGGRGHELLDPGQRGEPLGAGGAAHEGGEPLAPGHGVSNRSCATSGIEPGLHRGGDGETSAVMHHRARSATRE